jgi:hypothetical protein
MTRSEFELSQRGPSRAARVVVLLATIGVAVIAGWVLAPILLANYAATIAAVPPPPAVEPPVPRVMRPAAVAAPAPTTTAVIDEERAPTAPGLAAAPPPFQATAGLTSPWPTDTPAAPTAEPKLAAAPPVAATGDADPAEVVPLPRKRPNATIAARLAIPLPRPRPEIEGEVSDAEQAAFDLQVKRMQE